MWQNIIHHVIPYVFPTIIVVATTSMASAIMTESSLSFLGVGVQQPMSSWGSLLQNAQGTMQNAFYMAVIPGARNERSISGIKKTYVKVKFLIEY